jgi:hypothetical protein
MANAMVFVDDAVPRVSESFAQSIKNAQPNAKPEIGSISQNRSQGTGPLRIHEGRWSSMACC